MKKRILATLLSLRMVMSLLPVTAMEAGSEPISVATEEQLLAAIDGATGTAENPTVIQITEDIELSQPLVIQAGKNCIIDGNNHKITRDLSDNWGNTGNRKDLLTISSNVTMNNLTIDAKGSSGHNVCVLCVSGSEKVPANVIANNVIIENGYSDANALAGIFMTNATFVLNGGEIRGNHAKSAAAIRIDKNSTFTMNKGKIHNNSVKTYETTRSNALGPVVASWGKGSAVVNFNGGEIYDNEQIYTSGYNFNEMGYANSLGAVNTGVITFNLSGDVKFSNNYATLEGDGNRKVYCDISGTFNLISELKNSLNVKYYNSGDIYAIGKDYTILSSDVAKISLVAVPDVPEGTICYLDAQNNQVKPGIARTITFNANDGSGEPDTATQVVPSGIETALKENTFTRTGYYFSGWNTAEDGSGTAYEDGAEITTSKDLTLYAQWTPKHYSISYELNDGTNSESAPRTHTYGTLTELVNPSRTGYTFGGWYKDAALTQSAGTSLGATEYTDNITLYAKWKKTIGDKTYFVSPVIIADQTYTGSDIIPEVIVEDESGTTVDSKEYKVICKDGSNINAGK
ncbi:InlB B-repeat-containing protein, partial [Butyricicoccus pullicaecorum]|nr:InlB B-repeat-containing protein [Butyricicoccus pullicaecorum]